MQGKHSQWVGVTTCMMCCVYVCVQALVQYGRGVGLDLGQAGYQALASGCVREEDGMTLVKKMRASES